MGAKAENYAAEIFIIDFLAKVSELFKECEVPEKKHSKELQKNVDSWKLFEDKELCFLHFCRNQEPKKEFQITPQEQIT